ncbi:mitochondrial import inner membrane translocase subunit tim-13 [Neurospora tetraspora]|uniref:Mitochondrial import inner membrane translocase subunit n=1 Tax=Neurospora tetraspora TaxID=94610 RepID=A0AAE0MP67_9PEZI|nr:mitochondrial import inner membrane translocase subunit tim-13 [Neurospora tetraspora]
MSDSTSETVKKAIIKQVLIESQSANARTLMEKIGENCFTSCVPKPGSSLSSAEKTCVAQCTEKYMAAWNVVNTTYLKRIQQEMGNQ